jgi:hypothetical protein
MCRVCSSRAILRLHKIIDLYVSQFESSGSLHCTPGRYIPFLVAVYSTLSCLDASVGTFHAVNIQGVGIGSRNSALK